MNKIIAISLWGDNPRYSVGAIRNAELGKKFFPEWNIFIYYNSSIQPKYIEELKNFENVRLINCDDLADVSPYFWRFFCLFESEDNIVLIRDADSRLSLRERSCIDKWLVSNEKYSIIRDHIRHYDFPMLAGMWGHKGRLPEELFQEMLKYAKNSYYTVDQKYLGNCVWEYAEYDSCIVGISEDKQFNSSRNDILPHFVGQGYDENENPIYPVE